MKTINCGDEIMINGRRCLITQVERSPDIEYREPVFGPNGEFLHPHRPGEYGDVSILCRTLDRWIHEDELPEEYPYNEMFSKSMVVDGVRMFPEMT